MFGYRSDGKLAKNIDPFMKIIPHIMKKRSDAQVYYKTEFDYDFLRGYIREKRAEGLDVSIMHLLIAGLVRLYALRPNLNRFTMNGRIYDRNAIMVSLAVKKKLVDDANETTIKLAFNGNETFDEIAKKINEEICLNTSADVSNDTDKLAKTIMMMPNFLIIVVVAILKFMDLIGCLPKSIINASPFHTGIFITNLKSIGINYIYHHIYDFGTTTMFVAMGKQKAKVIANKDGSIETKQIIEFGIVADERICDGLYFANSMRLFRKILENPSCLDDSQINDNDNKKEKVII